MTPEWALETFIKSSWKLSVYLLPTPSTLRLQDFNFIGHRVHIPLNFTDYANHVLWVTSFEKQRFNQNNFKTTNPHLSWSAESTWWPRKNKSTRKECRCRQQLDTDVSGIRHSLQNATLHLCLCAWPKTWGTPTNATLITFAYFSPAKLSILRKSKGRTM